MYPCFFKCNIVVFFLIFYVPGRYLYFSETLRLHVILKQGSLKNESSDH